MICDVCGCVTYELQCKIICGNCGARLDCGDVATFSLYNCIHFRQQLEEPCTYCYEYYPRCIWSIIDMSPLTEEEIRIAIEVAKEYGLEVLEEKEEE